MKKREWPALKLALIFFIIVIIALILSFIFVGGIIGLLLGLTLFGCSIAGTVFSIIVIKQKKLAFGITFLVLFSIILLLFIAGVVIGVTNQMQTQQASIVGEVIANII